VDLLVVASLHAQTGDQSMSDSPDIVDIIDKQIPAATEEYLEILGRFNADHKNEDLKQKVLAALKKRDDLESMAKKKEQ
jgi:hypothetical protein